MSPRTLNFAGANLGPGTMIGLKSQFVKDMLSEGTSTYRLIEQY